MKSFRKIHIITTLATLGIFSLAANADSQTIIEPPAAPTGGNSASFLTTGATAERKLGSLLIGSTSLNSGLCLNGNGAQNIDEQDDPTKCITSWSQVINLAGGPFVALRTTGLSFAQQSLPVQYFVTPAANNNDLGAVTIQGTGANQAISLIAEANKNIASGAYALFASDGGNSGNYAAYFNGRVAVEKTILSGGAPGPAGRLCLNGTGDYVNGGTAGCITAWGQLVGALQNYVRLQSTNPATPDVGTAGVSKVANFGSVVLGHAPTGQAAKTFCGDGQCSTQLGEEAGANANYCPIDCAAPLPPVSLTFVTGMNTSARLLIRGQSQLPAGSYYLLLVRSSNPAFVTDLKGEFTPQNGVSYTTGMLINGVKVVSALATAGAASTTVTDTGLATNTTYYYRLYQANVFPIYNPGPLTTQGATNASCPDGLPPNEICL